MKFFFALTILSIFSMSAYAKIDSITCPKKIDVKQNLNAAYSGWRSFIIQPNYFLNNIQFYSGKPEEMASLVPDSINRARAIWHFSSKDTIYISCSYNESSIQLTQPLPQKTSFCIVTFDQQVQGYIPKQLQCS